MTMTKTISEGLEKLFMKMWNEYPLQYVPLFWGQGFWYNFSTADKGQKMKITFSHLFKKKKKKSKVQPWLIGHNS